MRTLMNAIKPLCLGIDPGFDRAPTACALLEFDGATPRLRWTHTIAGRGTGWQARINNVLLDLSSWLRIEVLPYWPPFLVSFELAHVGPNIQTALRLADLAGGLRGVALAYQLDAIGVEPTQSKVALTGFSNAGKDDMRAMARQCFGPRDFTEHEADAIGHALAGQAARHRARIIQEAYDRG